MEYIADCDDTLHQLYRREKPMIWNNVDRLWKERDYVVLGEYYRNQWLICMTKEQLFLIKLIKKQVVIFQ